MLGPNSDADTTVSKFEEKGFTITELIALMGTHSTAKDLNAVALDNSVGEMDVDYYTETAEGSTPSSLNSDKFLANSTQTRDEWSRFGASASDWRAAFVPA